MSTTELILEHLISGIQAAIWLLMLAILMLGDSWISWNTIKDIPLWIGIAFLAIAYPIGIFIDELADKTLSPFAEKIREEILKKENIVEEKRSEVRLSLILPNLKDITQVNMFFNYVRTRIRIARVSIINFSLITINLTCLLLIYKIIGLFNIIIVVLIGFLFIGVAIFSWVNFTKTFFSRTVYLWKSLNQ